MALLSVIVPVYNEAKTVREILERINRVGIDKEIIVVDDYSKDGTQSILQDILKKPEFNCLKVVYHSFNKGKGESVIDGINQASGKFIVIQDADLEYDPNEYFSLLKPLLDAKADLVLGARFTKGHTGLKLHRLGNKFLTAFLNFFFGSNLNDYLTCYKMASREFFSALKLRSKGFDIEAEIISKALKKHFKVEEVAISYYPRSYSEGKKIRWFDGVQQMKIILKYRFLR
jgi:glycosyltransferase involved in cell wall biosynthesis